MLDFSAIQNKLVQQRAEKSAGTKAAGQSGKADFQSLLIDAQLKMLSAWADGDRDNADESFAMAPDRFQMLDMLAKYREGSASESKPYLAPAVARNYQAEAASANDDTFLTSPAVPPSSPSEVQALIRRSADRHGIPQAFFERLIETESAFEPRALSPKGAMGLGQLMPSTARELGLTVNAEDGSVWDPESNLDASARYLRKLYDMYRSKGIDENESWSFAAGAYNAGMGNIGKAMNHLADDERSRWDNVAAALPRVTGTASRETIRYVDRLRA